MSEQIIVKVYMLGERQVLINERPVLFPYQQAEALFYFLAYNKRASRGKLGSMLWENADQDTCNHNIRNAIYVIKKEFGADVLISRQKAIVELNPAIVFIIDTDSFLLTGDVFCYKGTLLDGFDFKRSAAWETWLQSTRIFLQETHLKYLQRELDAALDIGNIELAERYALEYLQHDAFDENIICRLMDIYSNRKNYRKVAKIYHQFKQKLAEELGVTPIKETTDRYYHIMYKWNQSSIGDAQQGALIRQWGLDRLNAAFHSQGDSHTGGNVVLISGEAGIGKTFLLNHFLDNLPDKETLVLSGNCYQSESANVLYPWHSFMPTLADFIRDTGLCIPAENLATIAASFPEFTTAAGCLLRTDDVTHPHNLDIVWNSLFLLLEKVAERNRLVLVFEDIHWMDAASVALLDNIIRRRSRKRIFIIFTCRDISPAYVNFFIQSALLDRLIDQLRLEPFSFSETVKFIQSAAHDKIEKSLYQKIYKETQGQVSLLVQFIDHYNKSGLLDVWAVTLEKLLEYRLSGLDIDSLQVLDIISLFQDYIRYDVLAAISEKDHLQLLYICEDLKRRAIIEGKNIQDTIALSFTLPQFRKIIYERQSSFQCKILHIRIARLLEQGNPSVSAYNLLAYHFQRGGDHLHAFRYTVLELEAYTSQYYELLPVVNEDSFSPLIHEEKLLNRFESYEKELAHLRRSHPSADELDEVEATLLRAKGRFCIHCCYYKIGLDALHKLSRHSSVVLNPAAMLNVHRQIIYYAIQVEDFALMSEHIANGIRLAKSMGCEVELAMFKRLEGLWELNMGNFTQSKTCLEQSLAIFLKQGLNRADYRINMAGAHNYLGEVCRQQRDIAGAYAAYDKALAICEDQPFTGIAAFYTNYGQAAFANGDYSLSRRMFQKADEMFNKSAGISFRPCKTAYLALFSYWDGDYEAAAKGLKVAHSQSIRFGNVHTKGLVNYIKALIKYEMQTTGRSAPVIANYLNMDFVDYCRESLAMLNPATSTFEREKISQLLQEQI